MYIWYCITMYYMVSWIRWCLCGQIHRRCFPLRWSWIQILSCAPSKRGSNHNISQYCQWFFQLMSFFCEMGFLRLLKKNKTAKFICTLRQSQRSATWVVFWMPVSSSTLGMCEWVYSVYFYIWICIQLCVWILCEVYNYLYIYDWLIVYTIHSCMHVCKQESKWVSE